MSKMSLVLANDQWNLSVRRCTLFIALALVGGFTMGSINWPWPVRKAVVWRSLNITEIIELYGDILNSFNLFSFKAVFNLIS